MTELHEKYGASKGLRILGFPCNHVKFLVNLTFQCFDYDINIITIFSRQFANQEPGTNAEIKEFAKKYNVHWDLAEKIEVNGNNAHPLWKYLKTHQSYILGEFIKWNFSKFVANKEGQVVKRYSPATDPLVSYKNLRDL